MSHLDDGTLRRLIDEPDAVPEAVRLHAAGCERCAARRDAVAADAGLLPAAFSAERGRVNAGDAYARFAERARQDPAMLARAGAADRVREALRWRYARFVAPAAALVSACVVVLLLVFTPAGTLAQNFLTIFEPVRFVAIPVTHGEYEYLPDLDAFGTIAEHRAYDRQGHPVEARTTASAAATSALTGIPVRLPDWLPQQVPQPARFVAAPRHYVTFTFSAEKAAAYARAERVAMPLMPHGLDGSTLTLQAGPMDVVTYGVDPRELEAEHENVREHREHHMQLPPLVIVESAAPKVTSTGMTAREIEAYLLEMPGMSAQLAAQIRAIGDPSTTMPIPVPIDKAFAQNVAVDGASGLAVGDDTGVGGIVLWQKYGVIYAVAGALPQRDLMRVAASLR